MSAALLDRIGGDTDVAQMIGQGGGGANNRQRVHQHRAHFVPLDHALMTRIYEFYSCTETFISLINERKNSTSLGDTVEMPVFFGDEELAEPYASQVNGALKKLLPQFRAWDDMFGFVGVYDPGRHMDRQVREMKEESDTGEQDPSLSLARNRLERDARTAVRFVANLMGDESADELLRKVGIATEDGDGGTANRRGDRRTSQTSDHEHAKLPQAAPPSRYAVQHQLTGVLKRRRKQMAVISSEPYHSANEMPNSLLQLVESRSARRTRGTATGAQLRRKPRSILEALSSLADFRVVKLSEGRFFLEIDEITSKRRVVFARRRNNLKQFKRMEERASDKPLFGETLQSLNVDEDVFVYVWPDTMPMDDGRINTKMEVVMMAYERLSVTTERHDHAELKLTEPTLIFETAPLTNTSDVTRFGDQTLYKNQNGTIDQDIKDKLMHAGRVGAFIDAQNALDSERRNDELTRRLAAQLSTTQVRDTSGNVRVVRPPPEGSALTLPVGVKYSGHAKPEVLVDEEMRNLKYKTMLCNTLNMPLSVVTGGDESSVANLRSGNNAALDLATNNEMRANTYDRKRLSDCVESLWDLMFRDMENDAFGDILHENEISHGVVRERLADIRLQIQLVTEAAQEANANRQFEQSTEFLTALRMRFEALASQITQVLSMRYRLRIVFNRLNHISLPGLEYMHDNGAISDLQYANALRQHAGLPSWRSEAEYLANKRRLEDAQFATERRTLELQIEFEEKRMLLQSDMEERSLKLQRKYPPPQAPASGASSGSASKAKASTSSTSGAKPSTRSDKPSTNSAKSSASMSDNKKVSTASEKKRKVDSVSQSATTRSKAADEREKKRSRTLNDGSKTVSVQQKTAIKKPLK